MVGALAKSPHGSSEESAEEEASTAGAGADDVKEEEPKRSPNRSTFDATEVAAAAAAAGGREEEEEGPAVGKRPMPPPITFFVGSESKRINFLSYFSFLEDESILRKQLLGQLRERPISILQLPGNKPTLPSLQW